MKRFRSIIQDIVAPSTSDLWIKDETLMYFGPKGWSSLDNSGNKELQNEIQNIKADIKNNYLSLNGGTLFGNLRIFNGNSDSSFSIVGNTTGVGTPGLAIGYNGLSIRTDYRTPNTATLSLTESGVTIAGKTSSDILNAGGGTTSIDELKSQVSPDLSSYATKEDLSQYLPLTGGILNNDSGSDILKIGNLISLNDGWATFGNTIDYVSVNTSGISISYGGNEYFYLNRSGIRIAGKSTSDLLNGAGSTTPISDIATQVQAILVDGAPETLDTLNELAAALGDDPNFATTITTQLGNKADKSELGNYLPKTGGTVTGYLGARQGALIQNGLTVFNGSNTAITVQGNSTGNGDPKMDIAYNGISIYSSDDESVVDKVFELSESGITIKDKTTSDLLNGAGSTSKLKTINNQSLLGEGNIDTSYQKATSSSDGLMAKEDKSKLDSFGVSGIQTVTELPESPQDNVLYIVVSE